MNHAMGYQTMWQAWATTTGVEVMHMIRKGQVRWVSGKEDNKQGRAFIHTIFGISAPNFNDQLAKNLAF